MFGTTQAGGPYGSGTIFGTKPDGETRLIHAFGAPADDGAEPYPDGTLVKGRSVKHTESRPVGERSVPAPSIASMAVAT